MTFEQDQLYYVKFLDHCLSDEHILIKCEVCGWVISQDDTRLTITYWNVEGDDYKAGNQEPVNIIKSTILSKRKINV